MDPLDSKIPEIAAKNMRDYSKNSSSIPEYGATDHVGENPKTGVGTPSVHSQGRTSFQ